MRVLVIVAVLGASCALVNGSGMSANKPGESGKTNWFVAAKYGVFVHYLNSIQNNPDHIASLGKQTDWDECVREFDVEKFAERMEQAGAGYVIFTMMQISRYLIAPNATFDRMTGYQPGQACATRDLVEDLYAALHQRGIPLMLYWTGDGSRGDPQAAAALGWPADGRVTEEFVRNWAEVAREYGLRYKDKVRGFWVDGCYESIGYDEHKLGILADALRTGYPERIIALNPGVEVRPYSRHEDFTAGEQNSFTVLPFERYLGGEQWHILSFVGNNWGQPGTAKTKREMIDYVHACGVAGGEVSIDVVLYRDGDLDRSQLEVLKALRPGLAAKAGEFDAWTRGEAMPPRNKAWRKPAFLKSADGNRFLPPSGGEFHAARYGVDGDPSTVAQAGYEWAWSYEVNLIHREKVRQIAILFGPGFATEFEVLASLDGQEWNRLAEFDRSHGGRFEVNLQAPVEARLIRVHAIKPDGPRQPGGQMSIAELEVYE